VKRAHLQTMTRKLVIVHLFLCVSSFSSSRNSNKMSNPQNVVSTKYRNLDSSLVFQETIAYFVDQIKSNFSCWLDWMPLSGTVLSNGFITQILSGCEYYCTPFTITLLCCTRLFSYVKIFQSFFHSGFSVE
jgi:hypothetical protein